MLQLKPDKEAFNRVCNQMESTGAWLTAKDIIDVFGWPAMEIYLLMQPGDKHILYMLEEINHKLKVR